MNDIGALNTAMGSALNSAQTRPPLDNNPAAAGPAAMPNGGNAAAAQMPGSDQVSISPDAYRLHQTRGTEPAPGGMLEANQAQALLQRVQQAMTQNPQVALAAQANQLNPQRVEVLLN